MTDKELRGSRVKARREELGLTQARFADLVGVSRGTIRNVELGLVEPTKRNWLAIEQVLGWVPGSSSRVGSGHDPVELLPATVMSALLQGAGHNFAGPTIDDIRALLSEADEAGRIGPENFSELTSMVMSLPEVSTDEEEELLNLIPRELAQEPVPMMIRFKTRQDASHPGVTVGDVIEYGVYGTGEVVDIHDSTDERELFVADFGSDVGHVRINMRFYKPDPMFNPKKQRTAKDATRKAKSMSLPDDAQKALEELSVIDYGYYKPEEAEGVAVVTILVKTTDSPLAPQDFRYMADVWGGIGEHLKGEKAELKPQTGFFDQEPPF